MFFLCVILVIFCHTLVFCHTNVLYFFQGKVAMNDTNARTRKLIQLGGLVKIASLDVLDTPLLLGLLLDLKRVYINLTDEKKSALREKGFVLLQERKKHKKSKYQTSFINKKNSNNQGDEWLL